MSIQDKVMPAFGTISYSITELKYILKQNRKLIKFYQKLNKDITDSIKEHKSINGPDDHILAFPTTEFSRLNELITGHCFWKLYNGYSNHQDNNWHFFKY